MPKSTTRQLSHADYETLALFRHALRRFIVFSEAAAVAEGLAAQQHQALLAIKGMACSPTVGELAERLVVRHHSAVELTGRLVRMGLVLRLPDPSDRRRVRIALTPLAEQKLAGLSAAHLEELRVIRPLLASLLDRFDD
ncbi:MAG: MarR family transcriptional regulator [Candidimonas sp.]|nr:MAG: MarR family transcriptional regulator [Candidimonas sp.]TAM21976.1 MAG: MarR family transcriptional regulator [Candidimonas sp.]TAM76578.1 MAG: MarR family transcriptional regulator [Candidimonas sp.]